MRRILSYILAVGMLFAAVTPAAARPLRPPPHSAALHRSCAWPPKHGHMACMAVVRTDTNTDFAAAGLGDGYGPADLRDAYNLPSATAGSGQTVAIVDAFDNPSAEADLAAYRSRYGLPPCTTANGCFRKVFPGGSTPPTDSGWAVEIALDLDMVSAICPNCHIRLVEAASNSEVNLAAAENVAMRDTSVRYISNSWGEPELAAHPTLYPFGSRKGVAVTVSSGDDGYGVEFPASSPYVTAVGGTSLLHAVNSRGWDEIAWSGAGSGCSQIAAGGKPPWQGDTGCGNRTVADVAAVADPYTGVLVYSTFGCGGWCVVGGTSAAAPIIAALAGPPADNDPASYPYAHAVSLNDILGGTNSFDPCDPEYLCQSGPGYDGPTGLGTPNGIGGFVATTGP